MSGKGHTHDGEHEKTDSAGLITRGLIQNLTESASCATIDNSHVGEAEEKLTSSIAESVSAIFDGRTGHIPTMTRKMKDEIAPMTTDMIIALGALMDALGISSTYTTLIRDQA